MSNKRAILVVEDTKVQAKKLIFFLEKEGFITDWAKDGQEALDKISEKSFDMVISDVQMPIMDGLEMLAKIRSSDEIRNIPVMIITTLDDEETYKRAIGLEADDFIVKPFNPLELKLRVGNILNRIEAEELVRTQILAMESSMDGMSILNSEGSFIYTNQANVKNYGFYSNEEMLGVNWEGHYAPKDLKKLREEILPIVKKEGKWRGELQAKRKDGTTYFQELSISSIEDKGLVCICRDISQRKEMALELEQQKMKLHQSAKMNALAEMAMSIAHEINNPLTIIELNNSLIKKSIENERSEEIDKKILIQSENIRKTITRISNIIQSMRNLYRDDSTEEFEEFPLNTIYIDALNFFKEKYAGNGVDFEIEINSPPDETLLLCKKLNLSQVFVNLFNNAYDSALEGEQPKIKFELNEDDSWVYFKVYDSGPTITKDDLDKIFNPFYTTKDIGKGTGLGLSLCQTILTQHKGSIEYHEEDEKKFFQVNIPKRSL